MMGPAQLSNRTIQPRKPRFFTANQRGYRTISGSQLDDLLMQFAVKCDEIAASQTMDRRSDLRSQIQRASASVLANVAEGLGKATQRDVARFVDQALGSDEETLALLEFAAKIRVVDADQARAAWRLGATIRRELEELREGFAPREPKHG